MELKDLKPGDRIRVKSKEKLLKQHGVQHLRDIPNFNGSGEMDKHCGKTYLLESYVLTYGTQINTPDRNWSWDSQDLELPPKIISFKGIQ